MTKALKTTGIAILEAVMLAVCVVGLAVVWFMDRLQGEYDDDQD